MIFLIDYDRRTQRLLIFRTFDDSDREAARQARREAELRSLDQHATREIVLLEAESEAQIRKTHRRYFEDLRSLIEEPLPDHA
jgi:hypothetical protein